MKIITRPSYGASFISHGPSSPTKKKSIWEVTAQSGLTRPSPMPIKLNQKEAKPQKYVIVPGQYMASIGPIEAGRKVERGKKRKKFEWDKRGVVSRRANPPPPQDTQKIHIRIQTRTP